MSMLMHIHPALKNIVSSLQYWNQQLNRHAFSEVI